VQLKNCVRNRLPGFNRTIVGLKFKDVSGDTIAVFSFNRTIVGLKFICKQSMFFEQPHVLIELL